MTSLDKRVSAPSLALIGVVGAVGTGVLFSTAGMAAVAGPAVVLAWFLAILIYVPVAIVMIRLALRYPEAGGPARWPFYSHGSVLSLLTSVADLVWFLFIPPIEALALVEGINSFYPHFINHAGNPTVAGSLAAVGGVILMLPVNYYGIRIFTHVSNIGGAIKAVLYLILPLAFVTFALSANFTSYGGFAPFGGSGIFRALPLAAFGVGGVRTIINFTEEMRRPKDITKAVIGSLIGQMILNVLFGLGFVYGLDWQRIGIKPGDWAATANIAGNPFLVIARHSTYTWLVPIVAAVAILGPFITGYIYQGSGARTVVAMSRTELAGQYIGTINERRRIPGRALIMFTIIGVILAFLTAPVPKIYGLINDAVAAGYMALVPMPVILLAIGYEKGRPGWWDRLWSALAIAVACLIVYWSGWPSVPYSMIVIAVVSAALAAWRRPGFTGNAVWFIALGMFLTLMSAIGDVGQLHLLSLPAGTAVVAAVGAFIFLPWGVQSRLKPRKVPQAAAPLSAGEVSAGPADAPPPDA
jgi:amino acid transporter